MCQITTSATAERCCSGWVCSEGGEACLIPPNQGRGCAAVSTVGSCDNVAVCFGYMSHYDSSDSRTLLQPVGGQRIEERGGVSQGNWTGEWWGKVEVSLS
jgi:hypothetical protein